MRLPLARAAALALAALTVSGGLATGGTAAAAPTAPATRIAWGPCETVFLPEGAECGSLRVPLDWSRPRGATVRLALSRVRHTGPRYQGVMLVNPGGPGASGLGLATLGSAVPGGIGAQYDWIGFDPRGVGESEPRLSCDPDHFGTLRPPYEPDSPAVEQQWRARAARYAAACGRSGGPLLRHLRTTDVARDLEAIRKALGVPQFSYYGFSYGTWLGQVYNTMFPGRVRRMVLDGVVDPRGVWYQANLDQDVAFQRTIDLFFGWVARYDDVYHLGTTQAAVARRWSAARDQLRARPLFDLFGSAEFTDVFLFAGYSEALWPYLGEALRAWVHERDAGLMLEAYVAIANPFDDNGYAVYAAVQCTDAPWPRDYEQYRRDAVRVDRRAPFFTWGNTWYNAPCLTWPVPASRPPVISGSRVPPTLLVSQTLDAATPYSGALELRRRWPGAVLLAEPGGATHSGSLAGNRCTDGTIARFLATGALPARLWGDRADVTCRPLPQPVPEGARRVDDPPPTGLEERRSALAEALRTVRGLPGRS